MDFQILIILEVLILNLLHTNLIIEKKYSSKVVYSTLLAFSMILMTVFYMSSGTQPHGYRYVIIGFVYVIPLYLLYRVKFKEIVIVVMYCFMYTVVIGSYAIYFSHFFEFSDQAALIFIIQTVLFIISIPIVYQMSTKWFFKVLDNANEKTSWLLLAMNVALFSFLTTLRLFIDSNEVVYLLFLILLSLFTVISVYLTYTVVFSNMKLSKATSLALHDTLTGIDNRLSLYLDIDSYIRHNFKFMVLFLDLDNLKEINDKQGHDTGDKYLKLFSSALVEVLGINGKAYRFAGDEFVCIISKDINKFKIDMFEKKVKKIMQTQFEFNGVSVGKSYFPENGDDPEVLIAIADGNMYNIKRTRQKGRK